MTLGIMQISHTFIAGTARALRVKSTTLVPLFVTHAINGLYNCRSQEGDVAQVKKEKLEELHDVQGFEIYLLSCERFCVCRFLRLFDDAREGLKYWVGNNGCLHWPS
jgi:uncharacterized membrane protein (GlpM family)